jgi:hypothetical protein
MSLVEEAYHRAIDAMTPQQRIARVEAMLHWTRETVARQVRSELGEHLSDERIKLEVALRQYGSEPIMARLIGEAIADVSARDLSRGA